MEKVNIKTENFSFYILCSTAFIVDIITTYIICVYPVEYIDVTPIPFTLMAFLFQSVDLIIRPAVFVKCSELKLSRTQIGKRFSKFFFVRFSQKSDLKIAPHVFFL